MSRIAATFSALKRKEKTGLIPFITAGDPQPDLTVELMHALVAGGADVIELGVPFSDPMADGPVIQRASERALMRGVSLSHVLEYVRQFRINNGTTPVVLMGYANPIEQMGGLRFAQYAEEVGVDGVLVVDYPPEEIQSFAALLRQHALDPIFLLAPTSSEVRIRALAKMASGYVYYVSLKGVTGAATLDIDNVAQQMALIKKYISVPVGVGFGIRDAQTAQALGQLADAVVMGSRLVQLLEETPRAQAAHALREFIAQIRAALDGV